MGSSFSIVNDTEHDVWVDTGVNWTALIATVGGIGAVATLGIGSAAAVAATATAAGVEGAVAGGGLLVGGGALIMAEEGLIMGAAAATVAGMTAGQLTGIGLVTGASVSLLSTTLGITKEEASQLKKKVSEIKNASTLLHPGEKFIYSGTLSLTMTVYVMNDACQMDSRACWTGPTDGSDHRYPISEYFEKLDVKKKRANSFTVYSKRK